MPRIVILLLLLAIVSRGLAGGGGDGTLSAEEIKALMESAAVQKYAETSVQFVRRSAIRS